MSFTPVMPEPKTKAPADAKPQAQGPVRPPLAPRPPNPARPRANDVFPTTVAWLSGKVSAGPSGLEEANRHIMTLYAHPLQVYFMGCSLRFLGDATDIVQGFFADRLSRPEFLARWAASRRPLRFWLITGFKHYLMETSRQVRKHRSEESLDLPSTAGSLANLVPDLETTDHTDFDRAVALAMVREAIARCEAGCRDAGLEQHWRVFTRHHVDGQAYERIAPELGLDRARCAVMARTAANRFKSELRALAAWEDASEEQIDREIRQLLEVIGS
ncbi:MAG: hypothetical protein ACKVZJ_07225 [Phycisphaerales bacterium]